MMAFIPWKKLQNITYGNWQPVDQLALTTPTSLNNTSHRWALWRSANSEERESTMRWQMRQNYLTSNFAPLEVSKNFWLIFANLSRHCKEIERTKCVWKINPCCHAIIWASFLLKGTKLATSCFRDWGEKTTKGKVSIKVQRNSTRRNFTLNFGLMK